MKKIMLTVLAASALVACNNEETLKMQSPYAIDFADASVEGLTRAADPSFNNQSKLVTGMDVWAYLNSPNGIVLTDEDVTKNEEGKWSYNNIQYWVPGEGNIYYFAALAPMNSANVKETLAEGDAAKLGLGEIAFTNVDGSEDLLYAAKSVNAPTSVGQQMDPVKFTFNHLLSKVKFTFKNGFRTDNADIIVKNIQMSAPKSGTINLAAEDYSKNWVLGTEDFNLAFGDVARLGHGENAESADERLTIPATAEETYTVTFTVELYMGTVLAQTFEKTSTVTGVALEMGKAYNFVSEITPENLNLQEIEFDVVVNEWLDGGDFPASPGLVYVKTAEELAAALTADAEAISVALLDNIDLPISSLGQQTGGSGEYKLGGENTRSINIDLNGKKLNVTTTYWSNLGAKNNKALFSIKNGTMTSSQATGTWNSYDLTFSNCDYVIEDVVFEKAIAFDNANKRVDLKNVTINETHDYYAMWITAEGQTVNVDGLTINSDGRGIKIDEQYVGAPAKVTLNIKNATFKTANKAAILVKSAAGAEINAENIDITNVAADDDFAVWVDEDAANYADKVIVNGALVKVEGGAGVVISTATDVINALKGKNQIVYLRPAENGNVHKLEGKISLAEGVSLIGYGEEPVGVFNDWGSNAFANQAHFTNTTIENISFSNNLVIDAGIANGEVHFKDCIFGGDLAHQGVHFDSGNATIVFDNCTFVGRNMFGSSLTKVIFNNCTFLNKKSSLTGADKWTGVNMWGKYEFNNCVFDTEATCNVKCDGVEAAFSNCSFSNGADITGLILNGNKYSANITFDGNKWIAEGQLEDEKGNIVATSETGLKAALEADKENIALAAGEYVIPAAAQGKTLTIKGTGNPEDVKVAVTKVGTGGENCDYGFDGSNVTFEGITITTNSSTYIGYARCNGTYKNCIINGTYTLYGNSTFENCTFNVSGNVYNLWTWGAPTATFKNCTFNSDGKALLLYGQANTKLTVEDCTFNDNGGLDELKAAIEIGNDYNKSYELIVNNTTVNGFAINPNGISTGTTLWANKNSMGTDKLNVVVDGADVY